jgi:hypothetical protein
VQAGAFSGPLYGDDPNVSLSLGVLRFLWRLIWPF